jgi:hypothetical protein
MGNSIATFASGIWPLTLLRTTSTTTSFQELIDSPLPPFQDNTGLLPSSSKACHRKIPRRVTGWENFTQSVIDHRRSLPAELLAARPYPPMPVYRSEGGTYHAHNESELAMIFLNLAGIALNDLFSGSVMTTSDSGSRIDIGDGLRVPDFISKRCFAKVDRRESIIRPDEGPAVVSIRADVPVAVGEMKRHNLTIHGHDMVARYNSDDTQVRDSVWQLTGYQVRRNCRYGFLSTCEYTWVTRLLANGDLFISPAFRADVAGELSLLNMMYYVLCLAFDDIAKNPNPWKLPRNLKSPVGKDRHSTGAAGSAAASPSSSTGKRKGRDQSDSAGTRSKAPRAKSPKSRTDIQLLEIMVAHQDRITWRARAGRSLVIVKAYSDAYSRDQEARCYELLAPMQGVSIPPLLQPKYELPDDRGRTHGLVLSWVGPEQGGNYMTLPTGPLEQARAVIVAMHALGVAHGDVRPENMNYDFRAGRLFVYDFSHATLRERAGGRWFAEACREDLRAIDELVAESRTPQAQGIQYLY